MWHLAGPWTRLNRSWVLGLDYIYLTLDQTSHHQSNKYTINQFTILDLDHVLCLESWTVFTPPARCGKDWWWLTFVCSLSERLSMSEVERTAVWCANELWPRRKAPLFLRISCAPASEEPSWILVQSHRLNSSLVAKRHPLPPPSHVSHTIAS